MRKYMAALALTAAATAIGAPSAEAKACGATSVTQSKITRIVTSKGTCSAARLAAKTFARSGAAPGYSCKAVSGRVTCIGKTKGRLTFTLTYIGPVVGGVG